MKKDCNCLKKLAALAMLPVKLLEKYDLEANKISAAILVAGLIAMAAAILAEAIYPGVEPHGAKHAEVKRGYTIPGAEEFAEGAAPGLEAVAEEGPVDIKPFLAAADMAAGEKLIKRCTACHTFDKGGKHGVGPNNYGVVGGQVAHAAGFSYSDAMKSKGGIWTFQEISDFLANPKKAVPGNKMAFAGIRDPKQRADLIAYLNSLSDSPLPLPKE